MATKLGIIADVHANAPALQAVLSELDNEGSDGIVFLGDAIDIGPHPREVLDLLLARDDIRFVRGNHDLWYVEGPPTPQPHWMSDGERRHVAWTHEILGDDYLPALKAWPLLIDEVIDEVSVRYVHYGMRADKSGWAALVPDRGAPTLDALFGEKQGTVFYGHDHTRSDVVGAARYINPGALGCGRQPGARYLVARFAAGSVEIEMRAAAYDRPSVLADYDRRRVADRTTIRRIFFGVELREG